MFPGVEAAGHAWIARLTKRMHMVKRLMRWAACAVFFLALVGCEAAAYRPTAQVVIVTGEPSPTPVPTSTPALTRTPAPTPTPDITPTATLFPCVAEGGRVVTFDQFRSAVAGENLRYRVYMPPCYLETQKRYPYVILLHGLNSTDQQWDTLGVDERLNAGLLAGTMAPMIVVMPYMGAIGNENRFPPDASYETVLLEELIPAIERDFCTWNDREHRAIGGISRGGFWAYSVGLRHPDLFGSLGGHSAFFDTGNAPPEFNPLDLALRDEALESMNTRLYLDNGASDYVRTNLQLFSSRLSSRGIPHTYVINPVGDHDDAYWESHIAEYLAFYGRDWPRNLNELPSCLEPSP